MWLCRLLPLIGSSDWGASTCRRGRERSQAEGKYLPQSRKARRRTPFKFAPSGGVSRRLGSRTARLRRYSPNCVWLGGFMSGEFKYVLPVEQTEWKIGSETSTVFRWDYDAGGTTL